MDFDSLFYCSRGSSFSICTRKFSLELVCDMVIPVEGIPVKINMQPLLSTVRRNV